MEVLEFVLSNPFGWILPWSQGVSTHAVLISAQLALWVRLLHFILKPELPVLSESPPWPDIRPTYPFGASPHIHGAPSPAALQPRGLTGCRNRHSLGERGPDGRRGGHTFPPRALALTSPSAWGKPSFLCGRSSSTDRPVWKGCRVMWEGNPQLHTEDAASCSWGQGKKKGWFPRDWKVSGFWRGWNVVCHISQWRMLQSPSQQPRAVAWTVQREGTQDGEKQDAGPR